MGRHTCCHKQKLKKGLWSPEEDEKLIRFISKHGHGCWSILPTLAGLQRCGKSCRLRWINYLRPDLKRGSFSQQEEDLIIDLHQRLGNRWSQIAMSLPGRTDNEIKNFWNSSIKKKLRHSGIDPATHRPLLSYSSPSQLLLDLSSAPKLGAMHQQPGLNPSLWSSQGIISGTDFNPEWQEDVGSGSLQPFMTEGLPFLQNAKPCELGTLEGNAAVYKQGSFMPTSSPSSSNTIGSGFRGDAAYCENREHPASSSGGTSHWDGNGITNNNIDCSVTALPLDGKSLWTVPRENVWAELQEAMKWHDLQEGSHWIV